MCINTGIDSIGIVCVFNMELISDVDILTGKGTETQPGEHCDHGNCRFVRSIVCYIERVLFVKYDHISVIVVYCIYSDVLYITIVLSNVFYGVRY